MEITTTLDKATSLSLSDTLKSVNQLINKLDGFLSITEKFFLSMENHLNKGVPVTPEKVEALPFTNKEKSQPPLNTQSEITVASALEQANLLIELKGSEQAKSFILRVTQAKRFHELPQECLERAVAKMQEEVLEMREKGDE